MSKVPWHLIEGHQTRAHLVVGAIAEPDAPIGGDELTEAQVVLRRLVNEQKPAGDYAATLVRDTGRPEMYFAFDARKFAAAVKAEAIGSHAGWATQRAFEVDGARLRALEASLPLPKRDPRRGPRPSSHAWPGPPLSPRES
jgi:hypothetical protein